MQALTDRQKEILVVMLTFHHLNGRWPTIRDIGKCMEPPIRSSYAVWNHLHAMDKKGWIFRHMATEKTSVFEVVKP